MKGTPGFSLLCHLCLVRSVGTSRFWGRDCFDLTMSMVASWWQRHQGVATPVGSRNHINGSMVVIVIETENREL